MRIPGKKIVVLVLAALAGATLVAQAPAHAVVSAAITWNGSALSVSSVPSATVGTSFTVRNAGPSTIKLRNLTGSVSDINGSCSGAIGASLCEVGDGVTWEFGVVGIGTVAILDNNDSQVATLTLGAPPTPQYTMTFDGNGATTCIPTSATGPATSSYALPAARDCVRPGYVLLGWSADMQATSSGPSLIQPSDPTKGAQAVLADNGTLFAVWAVAGPTIVVVTFDANGGSGSMSQQTASAPAALRGNAFSRSGYTFAGWNTAADGSGTMYGDGAVYPFQTDRTLYAQWATQAPQAQKPVRPLGLPSTIRPAGWTRLLKVPVRTNAGQNATVLVTASPALLRTGAPAGDVGPSVRVRRTAESISVWIAGTESVVVTVDISAPASDGYAAYRRVKVYRVIV